MHRLNKVDIFYHDRQVGTMALYENRLAVFEYGGEWLRDGFNQSVFTTTGKESFCTKDRSF